MEKTDFNEEQKFSGKKRERIKNIIKYDNTKKIQVLNKFQNFFKKKYVSYNDFDKFWKDHDEINFDKRFDYEIYPTNFI